MATYSDGPATAFSRRTAARLLLGGSLAGLASGIGTANADDSPSTLAFHCPYGKRVEYAFEASGDVTVLDHAPNLDLPDGSVSADRGTEIEDGSVTGAVNGGYDVFAYEGDLITFEVTGGDCADLELWDTGNPVDACELAARLSDPYGGVGSDPKVVTTCTTIEEPGYYVLDGDLTGGDPDVCLEIAANDVVLDGRGYAIEGGTDGGVGLQVTGDDAVVRNLSAVSWDVCVQVLGDRTLLQGATLENGDRVFEDEPVDDRTIGLDVDGAAGCTVRAVEIYAGREGARFVSAPDAVVLHSSIEGGGIEETTGNDDRTDGVVLRDSADALLAGNTFTGFRFGGLVQASDRAVFRNNLFESADLGLRGLQISNADGLVMVDNAATSFAGFELLDVTDSVLRGNVANGAETVGIRIEHGSGNVLVENTANSNADGPGIELVETAENVLFENTARDNSFTGNAGGIRLVDADGNIVVRNTVCENNGPDQIIVDGASSGNLISDNDTTCSP
ncbi:right-handed parallel beta-helix repeat-containing protein [Salinarchaeum laminariae]|uniref:right-handed parallel beta-helix repeat-containing protein n=1 Tax=Salinarchaeum laminariae TaxID=869888 RepID=UPI0020BEA32C|nr:right-handed parallel beta-helix repeat-containing protein [Salinarchaeum laminariae]